MLAEEKRDHEIDPSARRRLAGGCHGRRERRPRRRTVRNSSSSGARAPRYTSPRADRRPISPSWSRTARPTTSTTSPAARWRSAGSWACASTPASSTTRRRSGPRRSRSTSRRRSISPRRSRGSRKVILLGHSGGSPVMSLYQAIAENGASYCQKPERLTKCGNDIPDADAGGWSRLSRRASRQSRPGRARHQSLARDRERQGAGDRRARPVQSGQRLQPEGCVEIFEGVPDALLRRAVEGDDRSAQQGAGREGEHGQGRLSVPGR